MKTKSKKLVAEICLYGNHEIGAGYLVRTAKGDLIGDGEPKAGRTMTEAVWLACSEVRLAGYQTGMVRVFAPGGRYMADADLNQTCYYGNLKWTAATVLVISAEQIEQAVTK